MISETALSLLEFHKLLRNLFPFSHSEATQKALSEIRPFSRRDQIEERLGCIEEIRRISHEGSPLKLSAFFDISGLLERVRPEGAVLDARELSFFTPFLAVLSDISSHPAGNKDIPFLEKHLRLLTGFPGILSTLERSIDSEGNILDGASPALFGLRREVKRLEGRIRRKLDEMVRDDRLSVFLQDNFITERSGRWVIPVRMDAKGQVPGVVHDISRSGETAFVEPLAIIGISNELENLHAEQKAEEIRILRSICSEIRKVADEMRIQYRVVVYLDLLNCIAELADSLNMHHPQINDSGTIHLVGGCHPLLTIALKKGGAAQQVVPLDVRLGGDNTVMVITGSNAGGKTIAIKTIGILLLMALSGMPVPADSSSSFPSMDDLLIDIGDEQSIESSLSTFSAHISNISEVLKKAGPKSLILIDELGTGTDPEEGAALACSVLSEIRNKGSLVFATTHLTAIKGFVHRTDGMLNASMEFDRKTFTPLYKLKMGEPGQSHALEIARKYGLPDSIIESARKMLGGVKVEFDNLIADLNEKKEQYENALRDLQRQRSELEEKDKLLSRRLSETEQRQKEILAKAYGDASGIIVETKREMRQLLDEFKKREKEKRREVIKQLEAKQEEFAQRLKAYDETAYAAPAITGIKAGDRVFVRSLGYDASVVDIDERHERLRVRSGGLEIEVPISDVGTKKGVSVDAKTSETQFIGADEAVSSRINFVGLRVDEALSRLEPFLNHASLAGLSEVTIIHGFGTGILAKAVREHLNGHPLIKNFRRGEQSEGGAGVTIAILA